MKDEWKKLVDVVSTPYKLPEVSDDFKKLFDAKGEEGKPPRSLVVVFKSTHAGRKTRNETFYPPAHVRDAVPSWTKDYNKPVLKDHGGMGIAHLPSDITIGRVVSARYVDLSASMSKEQKDSYSSVFKDAMDEEAISGISKIVDLQETGADWEGLGYDELVLEITDPESIDKFLREEIVTGSSGKSPKTVFCSVCGKDFMKDGMCEHRRGETYDLTDEDGKVIGQRQCVWVSGPYINDEFSITPLPANEKAVKVKQSLKDSVDLYVWEEDAQILNKSDDIQTNLLKSGFTLNDALGLTDDKNGSGDSESSEEGEEEEEEKKDKKSEKEEDGKKEDDKESKEDDKDKKKKKEADDEEEDKNDKADDSVQLPESMKDKYTDWPKRALELLADRVRVAKPKDYDILMSEAEDDVYGEQVGEIKYDDDVKPLLEKMITDVQETKKLDDVDVSDDDIPVVVEGIEKAILAESARLRLTKKHCVGGNRELPVVDKYHSLALKQLASDTRLSVSTKDRFLMEVVRLEKALGLIKPPKQKDDIVEPESFDDVYSKLTEKEKEFVDGRITEAEDAIKSSNDFVEAEVYNTLKANSDARETELTGEVKTLKESLDGETSHKERALNENKLLTNQLTIRQGVLIDMLVANIIDLKIVNGDAFDPEEYTRELLERSYDSLRDQLKDLRTATRREFLNQSIGDDNDSGDDSTTRIANIPPARLRYLNSIRLKLDKEKPNN